jgi:hypothetical protein
MTYFGEDTSPELEARMIEGIRAMPPVQRIEKLVQLSAMQRQLMLAGLSKRHPDASTEELRRRMADLLLGHDLARRAYGPPTYGVRG